MNEAALAVIAALVLLQLKHLFCDFFFQTPRQLAMKGQYGHPAGLGHAGLHVVGSLPIFMLLPVSLPAAGAVLAAEFIAHYHIDWLKAEIGTRTGWTVRDRQYWRGFGVDQYAHQITYLAMVLALVLVRG